MTRSKSASSHSVSGLPCWMPALLTRMSSLPWRRSISSSAARVGFGIGHVEGQASALIDARCCLGNFLGVARIEDDSRALSFSALAMAKPKPRDAPVTSATRPLSENISAM